MVPARLLSLLGLVLALSACAFHQKDQTVCPEFRSIRCVGNVVCSMDRYRGCRVCQCERAGGLAGEPGSVSADDQAFPPGTRPVKD